MGAFLGPLVAVFLFLLWFYSDIIRVTIALERIADAIEKQNEEKE